jgi:hypothetical protein
MNMTIVPEKALDKDPSTLPFYFKSMPVVAYSKLSSKYYFWKLVKLIEQAARMYGNVLVPATCFHWQRKEALKEYRLIIFKKGFYQLSINDLTRKEKENYLRLIQEQEYTESPSGEPELYTKSYDHELLYTKSTLDPEILYTKASSGS